MNTDTPRLPRSSPQEIGSSSCIAPEYHSFYSRLQTQDYPVWINKFCPHKDRAWKQGPVTLAKIHCHVKSIKRKSTSHLQRLSSKTVVQNKSIIQIVIYLSVCFSTRQHFTWVYRRGNHQWQQMRCMLQEEQWKTCIFIDKWTYKWIEDRK